MYALPYGVQALLERAPHHCSQSLYLVSQTYPRRRGVLRAGGGGGGALQAALPRSGTRPAGGTGTKAPQRERHRDKSTAAAPGWLRGYQINQNPPPRKDTARARRKPRSPPGIPSSEPPPGPRRPRGCPRPAPGPPRLPCVFFLPSSSSSSFSSIPSEAAGSCEGAGAAAAACGREERRRRWASRRGLSGPAAASGGERRRGAGGGAGKAGRRLLPLGLRTRCRSHTPRGEEPGGRNRGSPSPSPWSPGLPGRASCGRRLFPARRERLARRPFAGRRFPPRLAAPPSPRRSAWYVPFLLQSSPLVSGGRGRELPLPRGKERKRRGRFSALRVLPGQPPLQPVSQARLFSGLPWTRAVRQKAERGKPFAPPASGGWYAPARSPARQRRGSGRFHWCPGGCVRCWGGFPCVCRELPQCAEPLSRFWGALYPGIPALSRDTRSIPGSPLCRDTPSISGRSLFRDTRSVLRCPLSRGTRSGHGRSRFHLKQFQIKLQFKISPNVGVSRVGGAALPSQSSDRRTGLTPRNASV